MSATAYGWLVLAFPLAGTLIISLGWKRLPGRSAGFLATAMIGLAFAASIGALVQLLGDPVDARQVTSSLYDYASAAGLDIQMNVLVDPLSVYMCLIVSGVSTLIHLYSISYLTSDRGFNRFFAYLNFFVFSMLLLVLAGNLILLIVGWAFVGFASYALISFWYRRTTATRAGMKAFVINVIGDVGMVLAALFIFRDLGTFDLLSIFSKAPDTFHTNQGVVVAICCLLLVGAVAKSAQIPLHTWLPDAMEGPTPVSALIHAATMVTAGVYLIARTHYVFEFAPNVQDLAAVLGVVTLLVALVQTDIKRVIAYSTMSQIGYMFFGVGVGAYANGMFHLLTHAFFKALLFLAAALALVGVPPFAGFFSKDSILAAALAHGTFGAVLWVLGIVGTFLTGLYTFRMFFLVFWGEPSAYAREDHHAHEGKEGPPEMFWPVAVLAVLSIVGGWIQFADVWTPVSDFLEPSAAALVTASGTQEAVSSIFAVLFGLGGIAIAWALYGARRAEVPRVPQLQAALECKLWFDELYDALFYKPAVWLARAWTRWIERPIILGSAAEVALGTQESGRLAARAQTGLLRAYALALAGGLAVLVVVFISVR